MVWVVKAVEVVMIEAEVESVRLWQSRHKAILQELSALLGLDFYRTQSPLKMSSL
jgi:hypothetical protein